MKKFQCRNPACSQFGSTFKAELISSPRCVECGWYTHRVEPLFDYARIAVAVWAGVLVGWAIDGSEGAAIGAVGLLVFELLYGQSS